MAAPAVRSPDLAAALTRLRKTARLERAEAGRRAGCSHQTVWRAETTGVCSRKILLRLLDVYGVTDPAETARFVSLADQARQPAWWDSYGLAAPAASVAATEAGAAAKLAWEAALIPGLLQTPDYARAVITAGPDALSRANVDGLVQVRMKRQEVLHGPDPLRLDVIISEAALRTAAGGPAVMRAQLVHLAEAAGLPNVTVRAVPFTAGAHPAMTGAFAVVRFRAGHDVLYYDTPGGGYYVEDEERLGRAREVFALLGDMALPPGATLEFAARCAADL